MFNQKKFKALLVMKGKTMQNIADLLGINQATLYRKINGSHTYICIATLYHVFDIHRISLAPAAIHKFYSPSLFVSYCSLQFPARAKSTIFPLHKRSFDYYMEMQLHLLGYKIIYDEEDANIVLKGKEGEFEITQEDLEKLSGELQSFLNFKIFDLMQNSRKFGK